MRLQRIGMSSVVRAALSLVPGDEPVCVRICDGKRCSSLSQPNGGIILEGNKFVWSSSDPVYAGRKLKVGAKNLGTITM